MRSLPFYPMMVLVLVGLGGYLGCDPNSIQLPLESVVTGARGTASSTTHYPASIPDRVANRLLIGSFNIQRLGPSKLGQPWVMEKLASVIQRFDVIALQEITSQDQTTVPQLLTYVNQGGGKYAYTISPQIGRNTYFEQYVFVYDTTRVQTGQEYSYVIQDEQDYLYREPFVGRFQTISNNPFTFRLINMHTSPSEISVELDVLADVYVNVRQYEYPEDDIILLGDLNAAPDRFQKLGTIPSVDPLIVDVPTNTRKNKTLDNILIDIQKTREFTGRAGTIDLEQMFSIDLDDTERISDHLPIWAEFSFTESTGAATAVAGALSNAFR
ncbi:endonuclease/exonuclease/phosphatase family protein [Aureliella helgolandensis]|uniref:Endonuclease/Exonuclease/phosphatase family protein n=1 Tax=Aureliella helgolandensis TaxID=2527968 RepID=A0A518G039_9BACT|nr:endonuclease/exonuclease/phosphatase family protein [Aureliella helgolandensis]QDV21963.1 Endonuclease/Exonuclease/phosphatase family protein [Aureliella helgolandensis]